jgi:glycosyltransferase involved in cell wall biosynthesis
MPPGHQAEWKCLQIVRTFLEMGYTVDLISWTNDRFIPQKSYSVFVDVRHNMERLAPRLNADCVKIQHIDLCHMLYNNYAEARRLLELQQRKGVTLPPRRFELPNLAIEYADCATINGGEFGINTFLYAKKPIYRVPQVSTSLYPSPERKDFEACRNNYLWLGSSGFVRKGLDLVLDAFSAMPNFHLTVCGPIGAEKDFERAYYKELYETPNIRAIGWIDTTSPQFLEIANTCVGLVYTSCAEVQCGSVVTCLHAGLIPVISYEADVDVHEFGLILKDCSIQEIQNAIRTVSSRRNQELRAMAMKAWKYARAHHTQERFAVKYRQVIEAILAARREPRSCAA